MASCHPSSPYVARVLWRGTRLSYLPAGDRQCHSCWTALSHGMESSLVLGLLPSNGLGMPGTLPQGEWGIPGFWGRAPSTEVRKAHGHHPTALCMGIWAAVGSCCCQHLAGDTISTPWWLVLAPCSDPPLRDADTLPLQANPGLFTACPPGWLPPPSWLAVTWLRTTRSTTRAALGLCVQALCRVPGRWLPTSACPGLTAQGGEQWGYWLPLGDPHPATVQWALPPAVQLSESLRGSDSSPVLLRQAARTPNHSSASYQPTDLCLPSCLQLSWFCFSENNSVSQLLCG